MNPTESAAAAFGNGYLQGIADERADIIADLTALLCDCRFGYPESERTYYETSGNETRSSIAKEGKYWTDHMYCNEWKWIIKLLEERN